MSISGLLFPERKFTMFYVFLAEGFEETEALAPVDVMRRAKLDVKTVGVTGECVTSSHGVPVKADITIDNIDLDDVQGVVLPGGMPELSILRQTKRLLRLLSIAVKTAKSLPQSVPLRQFSVILESLTAKRQPVFRALKRNSRVQTIQALTP